MCNRPPIINRYTVAFHLNEALDGIHAALRDEDPDPVMWIDLAFILGHLCLAWHKRRFGPNEVMEEETQEEFELRARSVPNWGGRFRLVELFERPPGIDLRLSRHEIDRETVRTYLNSAEAAVQDLIRRVVAGDFDAGDISLLGREFEKVLTKLCLAWHLRYLTAEEIASLDPTAIKELEYLLPRWEWDLRLVPPEEEV